MTDAGNADAATDMGKWTAKHYETYEEASEAACEIRRNSPLELVVRVNKSPYGGFRLSVLPVDVYVDLLVDGILPRGMRRGYGQSPAGYP